MGHQCYIAQQIVGLEGNPGLSLSTGQLHSAKQVTLSLGISYLVAWPMSLWSAEAMEDALQPQGCLPYADPSSHVVKR